MPSVAEIEEEKKAYQEQLDIVLGQLRDDAGNAELEALKNELSDLISLLDENIAELQPRKAMEPETPAGTELSEKEKWSRDNHPAFKKAPAADEKEESAASYQVNDSVMAKWVSGDKAFYPAKITSITGSSTAPIYIVKFKNYDNTETLRAKDLRPTSNKRKADGAPATSAPIPAAPVPGLVSSADATVYPQAQREGEADDDAAKAPKPKKIKAKKVLEANKSKWQEFNSKSKFGKAKKKDSMFRTPDGINGRVGFTGSGQAMRKDAVRTRPHYDPEQDVD
ncbi:Tudor domain protein [Drechmeria coniospora]|uniref:Tudor domain protein n=1 Tax=Drechmeria coniospora TaxID=98403 RepID=A0A151GDR5_DRECN|nr:Tudor domain protein [Drechmeria coniospora]KYK55193.1 Tudor domain protein [Drechmeria coniospora]ODA82183.1 hypothetical protein RJ55_00689 [Drechmeria coniospora]